MNTSERDYFADFAGDTAHDAIVFDPPRRITFDVEAAIADKERISHVRVGMGDVHFLRIMTHVFRLAWTDSRGWEAEICNHPGVSCTFLSLRFVTEIEGFDLRGYK